MNKALLVGINGYPSCPLQGCIPDVNNMKQLLLTTNDARFSFQENEITLIPDADTQTWKDALQSFVSGVKPGDRLYFHYSGHGATAGDCELTGFQNCCCPRDFDFTPAHMLTDLYYHQLFSTLPNGVLFFWCSDSCHSANLDREMPFHKKNKSIPRLFKGSVHQANHGMRQILSPLPNVALMSGCMLNQTSADAQDDSGNPAGAFTWNLIKGLKSLPVNAPWTTICSKTNTLLKAGRFQQNPQTDGGLQQNPMNQVKSAPTTASPTVSL